MSLYSDKIFPWLVDLVMRSARVSRERSRALKEVSGEVLEIGFGTGLNLAHYPPGVSSLAGLDPSRGMLGRARRRAEASPFPASLVQEEAEELPFEDATFDSVVSTWSLCTIADAGRALSEVRRVLKPDGRFFFLEHGRAADPKLRRTQELLNPLNRRISLGCNLDRDISGLIARSGLEIVELHRYVMPQTPRALAFAAQLYRGTAVRGA